MENFIVSARKYRPVSFDNVVGQESITSTLKNAIKTNHLAQAYLFCGPRGVGKTTCARILAKTINCENLSDNIEACGECESCKAFENSRSFNIHELDAASNNKVDDIRTLTDQVKIPPQVGRYSIYIIDEVHMLSTSAFNAFLKTLEEPPAHAVFILATTEKQKIIPTILSRCQIFDFHRITIDDIVKRLNYVCEKEGLDAEQEALQIIAQKSDGSMRDGLSILDQIVSYSGKTIEYSDVIENLNVLDYEFYLRATDAFLRADVSTLLLLFNEILEKGFDGHNFVSGISSHLRNLLVCRDEETISLLEAGPKTREKYIEQTKRCKLEFLYRGLDILSICDINYKTSKNKRLHVELALIKFATASAGPAENDRTEAVIEKKSARISSKESKAQKESDRKPEAVDRIISAEAGSEAKPAKSFSIKDRLNVVEEGSESIEAADSKDDEKEERQDKDFSDDNLMEAWKGFGETVKESSPRMSSIIKAMKPLIEDGNNIILSLSNKAQKDYFDEKYKQDVLQHLKNELDNYSILFHTRVSETDISKNPYTSEEKFKHMVEKNPAVDTLKRNFRLDLE